MGPHSNEPLLQQVQSRIGVVYKAMRNIGMLKSVLKHKNSHFIR